MNNTFREITAILEADSGNPFAKLLTAKEAAEVVPIREKRLIELAKKRLIPHVRIDGGEPFFLKAPLIRYAARHLTQVIAPDEPDTKIEIIHLSLAAIEDSLPASLDGMSNKLIKLENWSTGPTIYFLCSDGEVVYVGQTINLLGRIGAHIKDKDFDSIYYLPLASEEDLFRVELAFIKALQPKLNSQADTKYKASKEDKKLISQIALSPNTSIVRAI